MTPGTVGYLSLSILVLLCIILVSFNDLNYVMDAYRAG